MPARREVQEVGEVQVHQGVLRLLLPAPGEEEEEPREEEEEEEKGDQDKKPDTRIPEEKCVGEIEGCAECNEQYMESLDLTQVREIFI